MCTRGECERHIGSWVQFRTPYGYHQGVIERVTRDNKAIVLSPKHYVPAQLVTDSVDMDDAKRLDLALTWGGFGGRAGAGGYPGGYGGGRGYAGGYGGYGYGWSRWAVSFLIIYALWGLWLW